MTGWEFLGYLALALSVGVAITGIWAARHYSRYRVYRRQLARERRMRREAAGEHSAKPAEN